MQLHRSPQANSPTMPKNPPKKLTKPKSLSNMPERILNNPNRIQKKVDPEVMAMGFAFCDDLITGKLDSAAVLDSSGCRSFHLGNSLLLCIFLLLQSALQGD